MPFERYVAIGDSSTEGLIDPDPRGGYRGWSNRLAEHLTRARRDLLYANLAIRGKRTACVRREQLQPALAMKPDLATVFSGTNDAIRPGFDLQQFERDVDAIQRELRDAGATVLTFTLPDLAPVMPLAVLLRDRLRAMNDALRQAADRNGVLLVDFAAHPAASDRRLWHEDRLHANALGHQRIAQALADALGLPGFDASWATPLPREPRAGRLDAVRRELTWCGRYLLPWVWRRVRRRSGGQGRVPKRPRLAPVILPD